MSYRRADGPPPDRTIEKHSLPGIPENQADKAEMRNRRRKLFLAKANQQKQLLGCSNCGYNKYGAVLEWHHLNPLQKDFNLSDLMRDASFVKWELYQQEIKKCILLCANCHREWHIEHDNIGA